MRFGPEWRLMGAAYACLGALALSGCAGFASSEGRNAQLALTGLMLADTAQTVTIARSPDCLREVNPLAYAGDKHPSPRKVLFTNALYIVGHWMLGSYLDRKANAPVDVNISVEQDMAQRDRARFLRRVYWVATGIGHGAAVASNARKGINPFSSYSCK